ncbi:MAG: hypothetical protein ABIR47_15610 [Candidatus Kapaibacterium sp.]
MSFDRGNTHGLARSSVCRSIGRGRTVLAIPLLLAAILGGCGPTRCLTTSAFGNLGPSVNSPYDDYAPALGDTAMIVFTSNRVEPGEGGLQQFYQTVRPTRLFLSMRLESIWDAAQPYRFMIDGGTAAAATITFAPPSSPFNTIAYVSACDRADTIGGCDIYAVTEHGEAAIVNLGKDVNSASWDGQPFVTRDGARLYFASDRPGGFGGTDIWISDRIPGGAWSIPHNAGPAVNTAGDELSPCYDQTTGRLFFSASTPGSGLDIFLLDSGAAARRPLPPPYNSEYDDFTPFPLGGTLYLASRRPGGCGDYDLYGFSIDGITAPPR